MSIYAIVLVLIGVSLRSSGKTTTNTAASKPAPAATDTAFKTLPGLTVKVTIARSARTPDRNCDGLAFAAAAQREYRWWSAGWRLILGFVFAHMRNWFDGAGWFVGLAVVLFVFALLTLLVGLQSPDRILWTGQQVTGTEQGGVIYYRWQGQSYSLDAQGYGSSQAVSVYLDPGDPSHAVVDNIADRVAAALLIGVPVAGGVALLAVGGTRNYRWARRNAKRAREDPRERARGQW